MPTDQADHRLAIVGSGVMGTNIATLATGYGIPVTLIDVLHAGSIAALGWRKIQAGKIVTPENLEANYIRRSDAEILHKMKENTGH